jgi:hypothetical protein
MPAVSISLSAADRLDDPGSRHTITWRLSSLTEIERRRSQAEPSGANTINESLVNARDSVERALDAARSRLFRLLANKD